MKRMLIVVTLLLTLSCMTIILNAQVPDPPHPNSGNNPNGSNTPVGGRAPIGGGVLILMAMGGGYGILKWYKAKRKSLLD